MTNSDAPVAEEINNRCDKRRNRPQFTSVIEIDTISLEIGEEEIPIYDGRLKEKFPDVFGSLLPNSVVCDSRDETEYMMATVKWLEEREKKKEEAAEETRKGEFKAAQDRLNTYKYKSYLQGEYMDKFAIKAIMGEFERRCFNFKVISAINAAKITKADANEEMESDMAPFFRF